MFLKELIETIAGAIVDRPEAIHLNATSQESGTLYELQVAAEDMGKLIGRDGRTINALRTVLQHAAQKKGEMVKLEVTCTQSVNPLLQPAETPALTEP